MDAAILIRDLEPFRQARPVWDRTAEMILLAATTGKVADIQEATRQLLTAVLHENWSPSERDHGFSGLVSAVPLTAGRIVENPCGSSSVSGQRKGFRNPQWAVQRRCFPGASPSISDALGDLTSHTKKPRKLCISNGAG